jgi:hypothetical protein
MFILAGGIGDEQTDFRYPKAVEQDAVFGGCLRA